MLKEVEVRPVFASGNEPNQSTSFRSTCYIAIHQHQNRLLLEVCPVIRIF